MCGGGGGGLLIKFSSKLEGTRYTMPSTVCACIHSVACVCV